MASQHPILEFNFDLASYIDESWLSHIAHGDIISRYKSYKYSPQYISKYLMKYFEIDDQYAFDIPKDIEGFAFLESEQLFRLVQYAGAVLNFDRIQKVILRKEIESLKLLIGEDAYYFGLRRSPIFKDIYYDLVPRLDSKLGLGESTIRQGVCCLLAILNKQPNSIRQRILFKLPFDWVNFDESNSAFLDSGIAINFLKKIQNMLARKPELDFVEAS